MVKVATAELTAQTNIVILRNEVPVVSHKTIADMTQNAEHSITKIIRENIEDFREFGKIDFMDLKSKNPNGGRPEKEYFLNEQQATLLMTYLRNNAVVKEFKKNLVRAFYALKEKSHHTLSALNFNYSEDIPLNFTAKDVSTLGVKFYQAMSRIAEKMEEQAESLALAQDLLEEQHELIEELTAENGKLTKENHNLKNDPLSMLVTSLKIATGREVQLSLGPTTGNNIDHTHTTIKGFCAEHKIKLAHGDSIRFSNILKSLCKQAGEIIEKIPDARYGTLNIYPRYLLADAIKFL